jgi:hypothetical protein
MDEFPYIYPSIHAVWGKKKMNGMIFRVFSLCPVKNTIDVFHSLIGGVAPKRSEIHLFKKQH